MGKHGDSVRRRDTGALLYDLHVSTDGVALGESQILGKTVNCHPNSSANTSLVRNGSAPLSWFMLSTAKIEFSEHFEADL